ncbi:MAG TPA: hypothetical protein VJ650_16165 [Gemmatimonadaceae bacterium]|nr:hypothetical protein [Gemmatimonadaceae bacterium]
MADTHLDWRKLKVEPTGAKEHACGCCGSVSRTVWGLVHGEAATLAAYFVSWVPGNQAHDASFDLVVGRWGDDTSARDRQAVSLAYRASAGSFMVVDAATRPVNNPQVAATALLRDEVVGHPIGEQVFAITDAIFEKEERIEEIRRWS